MNLYWRRFAIKDIPLHDPKNFEQWLLQRWREKDDLLEHYMQNNRFPSSQDLDDEGKPVASGVNGRAKRAKTGGYIEADVRPAHWWEIAQIFAPACGIVLLLSMFWQTKALALIW